MNLANIKNYRLFFETFAPIDYSKQNQFKISNIYKIVIPIQTNGWKNRTRPTSNIVKVWHGTDKSNLLSILSEVGLHHSILHLTKLLQKNRSNVWPPESILLIM